MKPHFREEFPMTHILIADRYKSIRECVKRSVESMTDLPCTISETGNGQEAWEIINTQRVDLVISGNTMPGMKGFELAKKVKAENSPYRDTPFIFCSGAGGPYCETIRDIGARNLPKPYSSADLRKMVREMLL